MDSGDFREYPKTRFCVESNRFRTRSKRRSEEAHVVRRWQIAKINAKHAMETCSDMFVRINLVDVFRI